MKDYTAVVRSREEVARDFYLVRLAAPYIAYSACPGQFVEIAVGESYLPFLRLPLSIARVDVEDGTVDLLFEDVGVKTRGLSHFVAGETVACLGPLGRPFVRPPLGTAAILVGGGIGIPPLLFLSDRLRRDGYEVTLLAGAQSASKHLPREMLESSAQTVVQATDDGSLGHAGLVTELLDESTMVASPFHVYTCGPQPMMSMVAVWSEAMGVPCQASLEEYMACGYGVCMGCVVEIRGQENPPTYLRYARVCVEGPVFDAYQVKWDE